MLKSVVFFEFHHKLDLVNSAKRLGYRIILITKKPTKTAKANFDRILICDWTKKGALDNAVEELKSTEKVKAVLTNYEHFVVQRAYLSQLLGLSAPNVFSACATRNKAIQRMALNALQENIDNALVCSLKDAEKYFDLFGGDVFLKSIAGIKSRHVFHVKSKKELIDAWKKFQKSVKKESLDKELYDDFSYLNIDFDYPNPAKNLLIEKACYGRQVAVSALIMKDKVWHTPSFTDIYTAANIGRDDSFLAFRILPSQHQNQFNTKLDKLVEKITKELKLKSCAFFADFILTPQDELKVIEVASRIGGYRPMMYRAVYNFDLTGLHIKSLVGEDLFQLQESKKTKPKKFVSLCEFFPKQNGKLVKITNLSKLKKDPQLLWLNVKAKKGKEVGFAKDGYEPSVVALLQGATYDEVYKKSLFYQTLLDIEVV